MQNEMQIWQLVMEASWLVKVVMLLLLLASVASWVIIFSGLPSVENVLPYIEWECAAAMMSGRAWWIWP